MKVPATDRLAVEGLVFNRAILSMSICVPCQRLNGGRSHELNLILLKRQRKYRFLIGNRVGGNGSVMKPQNLAGQAQSNT